MERHKRTCWDCGNVAEHDDNIVPEVLCKKCGSQDTRHIRGKVSPTMEEQRDAWRAACRLLYELMGEGGKKGRPMDALGRGDWGRIVAVIGKAESLESA